MPTQLIPVFAGEMAGVSVQLVEARLLHGFLESAQDFTTWIKNRIIKYCFIENQDYLLHKFMEQLPSGAKQKTDYHLTLDMAKELSMVERNEKGKQARRYFIDCERQLLQVHPQIPAVTIAQIETLIDQKLQQSIPPVHKTHDHQNFDFTIACKALDAITQRLLIFCWIWI